jgi:hypothetical protein
METEDAGESSMQLVSVLGKRLKIGLGFWGVGDLGIFACIKIKL